MKKILITLLITVLLISVMSGCKNEINDETTTLTESESTTVASEITETEQTSETVTAEDTTVSVTEDTTLAAAEDTTAEREETTAEVLPSETVTSQEETTVKTEILPMNEYDILRSGNFHIFGSMVETSGIDSPLEMAVTSDSIYMLSEFTDGVNVGILVYNDKVYMLYPEKKAYLEMDDSIMSMVGISIDDMMNGSSVDFTSFGSIDDAFKVTEEKCSGVLCKVYHIKDDSGEMRVYMNGNELIRFASYSENGRFLSATDVDNISQNVPAEKSAPPAEYKRYKGITGMFTFMSFFTDIM